MEFNSRMEGPYAAVIYKNGSSMVDNQVAVSEWQGGWGSSAYGDVTPEATVVLQLFRGDQITCNGGNLSGSTQPLVYGFGSRNAFSAVRLY
jgi:hypothetical protein